MGKEAVGMGLVNQNGKKLSFNPKEITGVQIALHLTKNLCSSKCNAWYTFKKSPVAQNSSVIPQLL